VVLSLHRSVVKVDFGTFSVQRSVAKERPLWSFGYQSHIIGPCRKADIVRIAPHSALLTMRQTKCFTRLGNLANRI